ncbi:MAG: YopX family protein [Candidatus Caldatribacteriota bacterium]|nr:YopX family protein [Candidatus Caldatribacteriota bacterium]
MNEKKFKFVIEVDGQLLVTDPYYLGDLMDWVSVVSRYGAEEILHELQWTGMSDKNLHEIYEGDILYLEGWNDSSDGDCDLPEDEIREVIYKDSCFCVKDISSDNFCPIFFVNPEYAKIIGNKYKNPELLKEDGNTKNIMIEFDGPGEYGIHDGFFNAIVNINGEKFELQCCTDGDTIDSDDCGYDWGMSECVNDALFEKIGKEETLVLIEEAFEQWKGIE